LYVPCRNTLLSLCLENAELKEQMGEALSDGWEIKEDKEKGKVMVETVVTKGGLNESGLQAEFRKLQGKLKSAHIITLLKEQLVVSSKEKNSKITPEFLVHLAREIDRINTGLGCSPGKHQHQEEEVVTMRPCPSPQSLDFGVALTVDTHKVSKGVGGIRST
jgi:myomegalin